MAESTVQAKSFAFALEIARLYRRLQEKRDTVISGQLLRRGTGIGASVEEALARQNQRDFLAKKAITSKGAGETRYRLRLLQESRLAEIDLSHEPGAVGELIHFLASIVKTTGQPPLRSKARNP